MPSWLKKGREAVNTEAEEQKKRIADAIQNANKILRIADGEKLLIRFLDEPSDDVPAVFGVHDIPKVAKVSGKKYSIPAICWGDDSCPFCKAGIKVRKQVGFRVIDRRKFEEEEKDGRKIQKVVGMLKSGGNVRILQKSLEFAQEVDELFVDRGSIIDREMKLKRKGTGYDTKYTLIDQDKSELSEKDKKLIEEAPSIEELLKPLTLEEALKLLGKSKDDDEDEDATTDKNSDSNDDNDSNDDDDDDDVLAAW